MKAICHLHCAGSRTSDGFREGPGPVAGDELEFRLGGVQPTGQRVGGAIGQQVDDFVCFQVDEDGAEDMPFSLRPVIYAESHNRFDFR
jgi:hypothetical protein